MYFDDEINKRNILTILTDVIYKTEKMVKQNTNMNYNELVVV